MNRLNAMCRVKIQLSGWAMEVICMTDYTEMVVLVHVRDVVGRTMEMMARP